MLPQNPIVRAFIMLLIALLGISACAPAATTAEVPSTMESATDLPSVMAPTPTLTPTSVPIAIEWDDLTDDEAKAFADAHGDLANKKIAGDNFKPENILTRNFVGKIGAEGDVIVLTPAAYLFTHNDGVTDEYAMLYTSKNVKVEFSPEDGYRQFTVTASQNLDFAYAMAKKLDIPLYSVTVEKGLEVFGFNQKVAFPTYLKPEYNFPKGGMQFPNYPVERIYSTWDLGGKIVEGDTAIGLTVCNTNGQGTWVHISTSAVDRTMCPGQVTQVIKTTGLTSSEVQRVVTILMSRDIMLSTVKGEVPVIKSRTIEAGINSPIFGTQWKVVDQFSAPTATPSPTTTSTSTPEPTITPTGG